MAVQKEREKVTKEELGEVGEEILKCSEPHLLFRREKIGIYWPWEGNSIGKMLLHSNTKIKGKIGFLRW